MEGGGGTDELYESEKVVSLNFARLINYCVTFEPAADWWIQDRLVCLCTGHVHTGSCETCNAR